MYQSIVSSKSTTAALNKNNQVGFTSTKTTPSLQSSHYCKSCDMVIRDPGHFHGTAHLVSTQHQPHRVETKNPAPTKTMVTRLELVHGKDPALQLMEKYGWRPGEGLGKSKQGTPYPVTTVWKQDRLGIGHPRTDRRRITHPSISKTSSNKGQQRAVISGKKLAVDAKAESALRSAMLHYMNN
ncbi:hypothetical protein BC941DRAFT_426261 [Chlamydoabsidia padenii]|nr:hypothetical protein BC941DRAFT_426261 [Chlamydoabsidia padenii]